MPTVKTAKKHPECEHCSAADRVLKNSADIRNQALRKIREQAEEITRLRAQLAETQKREQDLLAERKGEGVRTRRAIAEAKKKWLADHPAPKAPTCPKCNGKGYTIKCDYTVPCDCAQARVPDEDPYECDNRYEPNDMY